MHMAFENPYFVIRFMYVCARNLSCLQEFNVSVSACIHANILRTQWLSFVAPELFGLETASLMIDINQAKIRNKQSGKIYGHRLRK